MSLISLGFMPASGSSQNNVLPACKLPLLNNCTMVANLRNPSARRLISRRCCFLPVTV